MPHLDDTNWEARSDARTMAEAEAIKKDENRFNKATAAAVKLAEETKDEAQAMGRIANQQMFAKSAKDLGIDSGQQTA